MKMLLRPLAVAAMCALTHTAAAMTYSGPPSIENSHPPVAERLPETPRVLDFESMGMTPGQYSDELNLLFGRSKDIRLVVVYGYGRLVGYNQKLELVPDILERVSVSPDGRTFTFHLRKGHRWSDGHPFTSADFAYYWNDLILNEDLYPVGPPKFLQVDGELAQFTVLDNHTVQYSWSKPNPDFLPRLAAPRPPFIYRPKHFLQQFHESYAEPEALAAKIEEAGQRNWASLHNTHDRPYRLRDPNRPTLQPWQVRTKPPSDRFVFERNPYFHRVDPTGQQLPYFDRLVVNVANSKLIPAKIGAGEADLHARVLKLKDYTFLKQSEKRGGLQVRLWTPGKGSKMALYPNLNVSDPVWAELTRDVRFRRALSLAINRHEINQVIYYGLALEGGNTMLPKSPLYKAEYRKRWMQFDLAEANRLLDELGLTERDGDGTRLMRDGRRLEIIVETAGEDSEQEDVLELIGDTWREAGVKLFTKPMQREVLRNRVFSGSTVMSVFFGLENGLATADMSPGDLAPLRQDQLMWPKWGQFYQTNGNAGEEVDLPEARELVGLYKAWRFSRPEEREVLWQQMLEIHADQLYSIGLIANVPQPVAAKPYLRNLPEIGFLNWDPGAMFGIYHIDALYKAPQPTVKE